MKKNKSDLAQFAAKLRKDRGLTQEALAERAKVVPATIKNVETDRPVDITTIATIYAHALNVPKADWYKLVQLWMQQRIGGTVDFKAFVAHMTATETKEHRGEQKEARKLLDLFAELKPAERALVLDLLTLSRKDGGTSLMRAVEFVVNYARGR